ncbi:hypothetical protein [Anaerocolumna aminovalerica]|uniref:hypothetical protein n=1 Tax=Anaerocolumna aminovalerica TaxID=1527 RepID=UPI000BE2272C|nr:hypothetical protein [Anaerocolumna aminovalerica]
MDIRKEIKNIDWSQYETAYGNADQDIPEYLNQSKYIPKVSRLLLDLFSENKEWAMKATHYLWCGLCHQHAFVSSAALPAYDFLIYGLKNLEDNLKIEILDILLGFSICTAGVNLSDSWQGKLRSKLKEDMGYFQKLALNTNEEILSFAESIIEYLE